MRSLALHLLIALAIGVCALLWMLFFSLLSDNSAHASCRTHRCWSRVSVRRHNTWLRENRPWVWRFRKLPAKAQHWGRCVSAAESRNHRYTAGPHHSFFQWNLSTWRSAGGQGWPESASWYEQAVRAWHWHVRHPWGQWPRTGEGGRCGS